MGSLPHHQRGQLEGCLLVPIYTIVGVDKIFLPRCPVVVTAPGGQLLRLAWVARLAHRCIVNSISWTDNLARRGHQYSTGCPIFIVLAAEKGTSVYSVTAHVSCVENHAHHKAVALYSVRNGAEECREPASDCVRRRRLWVICVVEPSCSP